MPVLTLVFGLLIGCSDQGPDDPLIDALASARATWTAHRPATYSYQIERQCTDCTDAERGPAVVTVDGSAIVARTYVSGAGPVPAELAGRFPDVDGLFDLLDEAVRVHAWEINVHYDFDTGVPLTLRIDYEQFEFDDDVAYRVHALPAPPTGN